MNISAQLALPAKIGCLILNLGGTAELLAIPNLSGEMANDSHFSLRVDRHGAAIADVDGRTCRKLQQIQWKPSTIELLVARSIFPLSSTVVIFADRLGGHIAAARLVAGLCRFSPIVNDIQPPSLIVLCSAEGCTGTTFERAVTTELLDMLRDEHPERSYSTAQAHQMWRARLSACCVTKLPASRSWSDVVKEAKLISQNRVNRGRGLSERQFSRLLSHAIQSFQTTNGIQFSALQAFGIHNPVTDAAKVYLKSFLGDSSISIEQKVAIAASCLAMNTYRHGAYVSHPGSVVEIYASQLLIGTKYYYHPMMELIKWSFVKMVNNHQQHKRHLIDHHMSLMQAISKTIPGCSVCILKIPTHLLRCGHKICDHCLEMVVEHQQEGICQPCCPLCATASEPFHASPLRGGIRALGLSGSPIHVLKLLYEMREKLMGALGDYFDLIICTDTCAPLVLEYFSNGVSLPAYSRQLKSSSQKKLRQDLQPSLSCNGPCIACIKGDTVVSGYIDSRRLCQNKSKFSTLPFVRSQIPTAARPLSQLIETESELLWGKKPSLQLEYQGKGTSAIEFAADAFSALFYVELRSIPADTMPPFACQLAVTCRLAQGPHQNAVVQKLNEHQAKVYCQVSGQWQSVKMCETSAWESFKAQTVGIFVCKLEIQISSIYSKIRVQIDAGLVTGRARDISNSPCAFADFLDQDHMYAPTDNTDDNSGEHAEDAIANAVATDERRQSSFIDDQIEELNKLLLDWRG